MRARVILGASARGVVDKGTGQDREVVWRVPMMRVPREEGSRGGGEEGEAVSIGQYHVRNG